MLCENHIFKSKLKKEGPANIMVTLRLVEDGSIGGPGLVLVHPGAVTDPTAQHHGEDHLKDLNR